MLTDDFISKQCVVQKVFQDLEADEQKVSHLLCKVHFICVLQKAFVNEVNCQCREHLFAALYNQKMKAECEKSIQQALNSALLSQQAYIEKE